MGYAFAKNVQNNLPNCVSTFKKYMDSSRIKIIHIPLKNLVKTRKYIYQIINKIQSI